MEDPIKHLIKRQVSNMQMENRDSLISLYLNKYKEYNPDANYSILNKRIKEANPSVDWGNLKLGQKINIPMDVPKEEEAEQENTVTDTTTQTSTATVTTETTSSQTTEQQTTPEPSGKPDKAGTYPVCHGAECRCDQSKEKMPALLKVISHQDIYINDKESAEKLLATTQDLGIPFQKNVSTFGSCLQQPLGFGQYKPCIPNITKWDKSYQAIKIAQANNGEALLEESEGECSFKGKITFTTHGQTQVITAADVAEVPAEVAVMLTYGMLTEEQVHALATGTFEDKKIQNKPIEDINVLEPISLSPKNDTYRINVNQKTLVFKVNKPKNIDDKEKAAINWAVYVKKENNTYGHHHTFVDQGDTFTFPYRTPGAYAIEAFNDTPKFNKITGKSKSKAYNLLDIVYQQIEGLALAVDGKDRTAILRVRPSETVIVSAKKEFPDNDLNPKHIVWEATLDGKNIPFTKDKTVPQITIPPQKNTTAKKIVVKATYENIEKKITFTVEKNYIKKISADKDSICVLKEKETKKERHQVTFTAHYQLPYNAALGDPKPQWCWYNRGQKPDTHTVLQNENELTYTGTSEKEGEWNIEAFTEKPKGLSAPLKAIKSRITKAYWADKNGNSISKSGFKHTVYIHIETQALQGEKLQLNVWESQKGKDDFKKNAGVPIEIKERNGIINQAYTIPDGNPGYWKENNKYEFFFTIETLDFEVEGTMQDPEAENQYILIPAPDKKVRYLHVDKEQAIVNLRIYETDNQLHTGIVKYGDTVTIKINTRNYIDKPLEFKIWEDVKIDNHTDEYSVYDTYDDKEQKGHVISFKVDGEGKGEALFTIPKEWENKHHKLAELPRYFYLKEKESGVEFPRAYYVANPNKTEEENKKNSNRIIALMLKVAKTLPLKDFMEVNSAVILGSEPSFAPNKAVNKESSENCPELIWGKKVSCKFRRKVVEISKKLNLGKDEIEGANWLMTIMAFETGGSFSPSETNSLGYTGLIQFGSAAASEIGTTQAKLKKMSAEYQLNYVLKYFEKKRFSGKLKTLTDLYLAVNYPAACGQGKNQYYVVYDSSRSAYDANPSFKKEENEFYIEKGKKKYYKGKEGKSYVWEFKEELINWSNNGSKSKNNCVIDDCDYIENNCSCGKTHIDLRSLLKFKEQGSGNQYCLLTCQSILKEFGINSEGPVIEHATKRHAFYQLALEDGSHTKLVYDFNASKEGIKYINKELDNNRPIIVGVDHTLDGGINNEQDIQTTDHFVIIVGRGCEKEQVFYQYWDVATQFGEKEKYKFIIKDNKLINETAYAGRNKPEDSRKFTVTQIRRNKGHETL